MTAALAVPRQLPTPESPDKRFVAKFQGVRCGRYESFLERRILHSSLDGVKFPSDKMKFQLD